MQEYNKDGLQHFKFEPSEDEERRLFESQLAAADQISDVLLELFTKSLQKAELIKRETWDAMHEKLGTDPTKVDLIYNHLTRSIKVVPRKEQD